MLGYFGLIIMCFLVLVWGNFHIRLIYPVCAIGKGGSWNKKYKHYKNRFRFFQRFFLLFLLDKDNRHSIWFRIYFILHYIECGLTIWILNRMCFDDNDFIQFLFCALLLLTIITISIALEIPHMD